MIEVLTRELRHEIAGYRDFVRYRAHAQRRGAAKLSEEILAKRLAGRRKQLRARIQGRQNREEDRTPSAIRRLFRAR